MSTEARRVLGLTIVAGTVYAAVVECPEMPLLDDPFERLDLAEGLEGPAQLADFSARFKQELRRVAPLAVGVLNTRKYSNWKYTDVFKRVSLEAAVMLAVEELSMPARTIRYVLVTQEGLPKAAGIDAKTFPESAHERWGGALRRYARERAVAIATAVAVARRECP